MKFSETTTGYRVFSDRKQIGRIFRSGKKEFYKITVYSSVGNVAAIVYRGAAHDKEQAKELFTEIVELLDIARTCNDSQELISKLEQKQITAIFPESRCEMVIAAAKGKKLPEKDIPIECSNCNRNHPFDFYKIDFVGNRKCPSCRYSGDVEGIDWEGSPCDYDWNRLFNEDVFLGDEEEEDEVG